MMWSFIRKRMVVGGLSFLLAGHSLSLVYAAEPGQELYESNCAACHGDDGTPVLPGTPIFSKGERLNKSDDELMKSIVQGLNVMPPWAGILDKKEMKDCLNFIKKLAG